MRCYLNILEYLLQAWLDQNVIFMVLATLKVYFFSSALVVMISAIKDSSLPLCLQLENLANDLEQAPAHMSRITKLVIETLAANFLTLIKKMIYLVAMVAKSIISLLVELYLGTLTCLITALIKGTLELVSDILQDITQFIQKAINAVLKDFNAALSGLSAVVNTITSAVNAVESLFSSSDKSRVSNNISKVNLTVASLTSISIPTTWIGDIENLSNEVPDFEEVLGNVSSLLTSPITHFSEAFANKSFNFTLNDSFLNGKPTDLLLERTIADTLLSPDQLELYSNNAKSVCDEIDIVLAKTISAVKKFTGYIILGLIIFTVVYALITWIFAYLKIRKRHRLYVTLTEVEDPTQVGNTICRFEHGFISLLTSRWSPESQWLYTYVSTPNLTRCLILGLIGWMIVLLQFITIQQAMKLLKSIAADGIVFPTKKGELVDDFAHYLDDAQLSLDKTVDEVNDALFSSIHNTSSLMLDGIGFFQSTVNGTINTVFGSSFLANPLRTIIYCTIGRKVESIEDGLQWIQKNTIFESPTLDKVYMEAMFEQSTTDVSGMLLTIAEQILESVEKMIKSQRKALWKEFFIATAFVAIWFLYLLLGLMILANRKVQIITGTTNRVSTQAISWPSQLCEEAQREYHYPYNDPYGVPYLASGDEPQNAISKPRAVSPEIDDEQSSLREDIPNERSSSLPHDGWRI